MGTPDNIAFLWPFTKADQSYIKRQRILPMNEPNKHSLLWVILFLTVLAFVPLPLTTGGIEWDGGTRRTISVQVLDNDSDYPISGATVYLRLRRDRQFREALLPEEFQKLLRDEGRLVSTDKDGRANVIGAFGAGGTRNFFGKTGYFNMDAQLHITHPDFSPMEGLLQSYLGARRLPLNTSNLHVTIYLIRSDDPFYQSIPAEASPSR